MAKKTLYRMQFYFNKFASFHQQPFGDRDAVHSFRNFRWSHIRARLPSIFRRYGIMLLSVLVFLTLRFYLGQFIPPGRPFILVLFAAVITSAVYGGLGPGIIATILCAFAANTFFFPEGPAVWDADKTINLAVFAVEGVILCLMSDRMHTAVRKSEQQAADLRLSEARWTLLLRNVKDYAIIILDGEGNMQSWNEGARSLLGYSRDDVRSKHISQLYTKEDIELLTPWNQIKEAEKRGKVEGECWLEKKDGEHILINIIITALRSKRGDLKGFTFIGQDVTEKRALDKRKDEFISIASHELKTPITSLKAYIQILQRKLSEKVDDDSQRILGRLDGQLNRLTELVNELLDVGRIQAGKLELHTQAFLMDDLVHEIVIDFRESEKEYEIVKLGKTRREILADRDRIGQVLTNFISNAIKYSPEKGKITVRLEENPQGVVVSVADRGVGIGPEEQKKIFERFYRVESAKTSGIAGLGLGLSIASEIIKQHNGKIWVESAGSGKSLPAGRQGSTFFFMLPFTQKIAQAN